MAEQKQAVVELVDGQRVQGRTVGEVLGHLGVARSSYYGGVETKPSRTATVNVATR